MEENLVIDCSKLENQIIVSKLNFISINNPPPILSFSSEGVLTWYIKGNEIKIENEKMLLIAFFDFINQSNSVLRPENLVSKELYEEYQRILSDCS